MAKIDAAGRKMTSTFLTPLVMSVSAAGGVVVVVVGIPLHFPNPSTPYRFTLNSGPSAPIFPASITASSGIPENSQD